jgi:hypothetical protein
MCTIFAILRSTELECHPESDKVTLATNVHDGFLCCGATWTCVRLTTRHDMAVGTFTAVVTSVLSCELYTQITKLNVIKVPSNWQRLWQVNYRHKQHQREVLQATSEASSIYTLIPGHFPLRKTVNSKAADLLKNLFLLKTSWNSRRCSGFKIKWKNSSDMFVAGFWIVATPNLVGIG